MSFTLRHMKPYSGRLVAYGFLVVLSVLFTMATALSVADFVKILFPPAQPESGMALNVGAASASNLLSQGLQQLYLWLVSFGPKHALIYFSLLLLLLYSCKNIFSYLSLVQISVVRYNIVRDIRNRLFRKAMSLPLSYFSGNRRGDILARFAGDITEYDENLLGSLQLLFTAVVSIVLYVAMLFYISLKLSLFVLCMLPVVVFVISGITHRLRRDSVELQESNSFLMSLMEESIIGLKVIKAYTAIDFSNRRFREADRRYARLRTRVYRRVDLSSPVSDFLGNCVVIGILLFGSLMVIQGTGITPELFVSYIMMFVLMIPPAKNLTTALSQIKRGKGCVERLQQFLSLDEEPLDSPQAQPFSGVKTQIEFKDVSFSYVPDVPVLSHISLSIPRGATVALVGSSGSGKSTLADLLLRFHDPDSGQILIDGVPLQTFNRASLRRGIGVVSQQTFLFNDTVMANIAYGMPDATPEQVEQAARAAGAHQFITALPQGYLTPVGDSGALLSGGQRQRISIARALLTQPEVFIFDEATSALDSESEALVQQTLTSLLHPDPQSDVQGSRTALVIAHRLSTTRWADIVVVLENGHIVEQGSPDQLLQSHGRYWELNQVQTSDFIITQQS